jgi:hypothetical protein
MLPEVLPEVLNETSIFSNKKNTSAALYLNPGNLSTVFCAVGFVHNSKFPNPVAAA